MKENRQAAVPFILVTVFLDMMGIAIVIPVLPGLIATFTADRDAQTYWYGAMLASYGLMQFVSAPLLGALSDRVAAGPFCWCRFSDSHLLFCLPRCRPSFG
jgi:DHA1 family tetracycline resistance protein-like MFS transporter